MKKLKASILLVFLISSIQISAQSITVDEIFDGYYENTGGLENWKKMTGTKIVAKVNQGGMEIPLEIVQFSDGRQYTKFNVQGNDFYQNVYDGETLWSVNFQSLKAEESDAETTANFKLDINDFPDDFINYKKKGYTVELMGTETIDGAETYKIKITKEPRTIDGKQVDNVVFYYFDTEALVPIAQDAEVTSGPQAGSIGRVTMSDYDEIDGLYFPFSLTQGVKDGPSQPLVIESIEVNPTIDESVFKFPTDGQ